VRVVLTREKGFNDEQRTWLPDGAVVDEVPLTTTRFFEVTDVAESLKSHERYGTFAAVVVSSARSVPYVPLARAALREGGTVLAVGERTAKALRARGISVDVVGEGGSLSLQASLSEGPVLLLGAANSRNELRDALTSNGIEVFQFACYETWPAILHASEEQILRRGDVVFIGAPSAWSVAQGFVSSEALVVVPGATTAENVRASHQRVLEGWGPELKERLASQ
jgi:uroporphyrinogen-III synthase